MKHTTTLTTPAALQQQMLDLIEELRTAPSYRRQQRCLAELEVLRYQLHGHVDLLEKLAALQRRCRAGADPDGGYLGLDVRSGWKVIRRETFHPHGGRRGLLQALLQFGRHLCDGGANLRNGRNGIEQTPIVD